MTIDIAKALRDAYGRGFSQSGEVYNGEHPGDAHEAEDWRKRRDAWIAQYMVRMPTFQDEAAPVTSEQWRHAMGKEQTQVDDVTVTVSAPPGKRAVVVRNGAGGTTSTQTVVGGQSHSFTVGRDDVLLINEGEQHSTVAHQGE